MRASCTPWATSTTPPLLPHRHHRNRCPCDECSICRGSSTPGDGSVPAKAALAVGLVVGGFVVGRGRAAAPLLQSRAANGGL